MKNVIIIIIIIIKKIIIIIIIIMLGGSFIGRCARNMELNAVTNGMSIPPKA